MLTLIQQIKEVERKRIKEYADRSTILLNILKEAKVFGQLKRDVVLPCATQE